MCSEIRQRVKQITKALGLGAQGQVTPPFLPPVQEAFRRVHDGSRREPEFLIDPLVRRGRAIVVQADDRALHYFR